MTLQNTFEDDILKLILQAVAIANFADNAASAPITNLHVSLHTADPGEAGAQNTSETSYTGYLRVAVARTTGGWGVTSGVGSNLAVITFGQCTAGSATLTHAGIGRDSIATSSTGKLLISGALTASLAVSAGITPSFGIGALTVTMD